MVKILPRLTKDPSSATDHTTVQFKCFFKISATFMSNLCIFIQNAIEGLF
jgi:hypothetical protein